MREPQGILVLVGQVLDEIDFDTVLEGDPLLFIPRGCLGEVDDEIHVMH